MERQTVGSTSMTNSGSADETESEMRTRKTRQTACSRKRIWKARARQKSPRIVFEADLWKMLKNSTPWVWLEWIEFFSFFQHFSAFWKLMNAHFSKKSCYSRYSIINEWPQCRADDIVEIWIQFKQLLASMHESIPTICYAKKKCSETDVRLLGWREY